MNWLEIGKIVGQAVLDFGVNVGAGYVLLKLAAPKVKEIINDSDSEYYKKMAKIMKMNFDKKVPPNWPENWGPDDEF